MPTIDDALPVLLIEDNPGDARLVKEALSDARFARWRLSSRPKPWPKAWSCSGQENFVAVLLDLTLPDCIGAETIARVHAAAPTMPIVILTGLDDEAISRDAVKSGAQDYLVKGLFDGGLLSRALFYAIERARFREELMKARDDALQAAKLKSEFLAIISHEMRTPMNAIVGPVELLLDTALDEEQTELATNRAQWLAHDARTYQRHPGLFAARGRRTQDEGGRLRAVRDPRRATRRLHGTGEGKRSRDQHPQRNLPAIASGGRSRAARSGAGEPGWKRDQVHRAR